MNYKEGNIAVGDGAYTVPLFDMDSLLVVRYQTIRTDEGICPYMVHYYLFIKTWACSDSFV